MTWLLTAGCGGGGGGGEENSANSGASAPESLHGRTLVLSGSNREIAFDPDGTSWTEIREGSIQQGTYEYSKNGNGANLVLSQGDAQITIQLLFSTNDAGSYTAPSDQGAFNLRFTQNPPQSPGDQPPDPSALAPSSVAGRTMRATRTFTSTGPVGQTHVYTFSGSGFHDSDPPEESDGTYDFQPEGNRATLILMYKAPKGFDGDRHELTLNFQTVATGTFESTYTRRDGTVITINGTFQLD